MASVTTAIRIATRKKRALGLKPFGVIHPTSAGDVAFGCRRYGHACCRSRDLVGPIPAPGRPGRVEGDLVAINLAIPDHGMRCVRTLCARGEVNDTVDHLRFVVTSAEIAVVLAVDRLKGPVTEDDQVFKNGPACQHPFQ